MRVAIYTRVSTEQQVDRDSLAAQKSALLAFCKSNDHRNVQHYEDAGVSAKDAEREGLQKLLTDIKAGKIDLVVVTKLDRMMRSTQHMLELLGEFRKHNVVFKSLSDPIDNAGPTGNLLLQLLSVLAEFERRLTAERVRSVMDYRAKGGQWNGGVIPFGYTTRDRLIRERVQTGLSSEKANREADKSTPEFKRLYVDPAEAATVRLMVELFLEIRTILGVTTELNRRKVRTRNGGEWTTTSVRRALGNPQYVGKLTWGQRRTDEHTGKLKKGKDGPLITESNHEPILDNEVFAKVEQLLKQGSFKRTKPMKRYLLGGLLHCRACGRIMYGYTYRKKDDAEYSYYRCPQKRPNDGNPECKGQSLPGKPFEEFIVGQIMELSKNTRFLNDREKMVKGLQAKLARHIRSRSRTVKSLRRREQDLRRKMDTLVERLEDETITRDLFKDRYQKHEQELAEITAQMESENSLEARGTMHAAALQISWEQISSFGHGWGKLDLEAKRNRLLAIVHSIQADREKVDLKLYLDDPGGDNGSGPNSGPTNSRNMDERMPLRIFLRPAKGLQMLAVANREIPGSHQRPTDRPDRHSRRGSGGALPGTAGQQGGHGLGDDARPSDRRPAASASKVPRQQPHGQRTDEHQVVA